MHINEYKKDNRTTSEFIADMEKGLQNEVKAIRKFRKILLKSKIENPDITYCGSDTEGEITYDKKGVAEVDLFPDYLLRYKKKRKIQFKFIEVKVCNPHSDYAYFKVKQLNQFNQMGSVAILFVMGFETEYPMFVLVEPQEILDLGIEPEEVYGKATIKVPTEMLSWEVFHPIDRKHIDLINRKYINNTGGYRNNGIRFKFKSK